LNHWSQQRCQRGTRNLRREGRYPLPKRWHRWLRGSTRR